MTTSSTTNQTSWIGNYVDYKSGIGKIMQWAQLMGAENMQAQYDEQQANRDAESEWVRKNVWGKEQPGESEGAEDDSMRQTILGDVTHPTPMVIQGNQGSGLGTLGALALGALGPSALLAGAVGYWLASDSQDSSPPQFDDATTKIELGRIEDYLRGDE